MDKKPVRFQPTSQKAECVLCGDRFTLDKLCDVHLKCGAMCCEPCIIYYIQHSLNEHSGTPFPPVMPCACPPEDGGNDPLLPSIYCPVARFLGPDIMEQYLHLHRQYHVSSRPLYISLLDCRYTNHSQSRMHRIGLTETQKQQMDQEIAQAINEVAPFAAQNSWKQCPACQQFIEYNGGCWSMLCLCGQRFCFQCGRRLGMGENCVCSLT